jgi:protease-4
MKATNVMALAASAALAAALAGCRSDYTTEEAKLSNYALERVERGKASASILMVPVHGVIASEDGAAPAAIAMLRQLRTENEPSGIKVVILHLDSPGGDVTASDVLAHEVRLCREKGYKFVAFCGDTCASGAYYLAAGADRIVARPTSIVGSIGVIMMHFDAQKLLTERLGVRDESVTSGPYKEVPSFFRPMTEPERKYLQNIVNALYDRFVKTVVDGRKKLKEADVRALADGRVFTAEQALANGLIDAIGQREEAIAEARKLAGEDASVLYYRREPGFWERLTQGEAKASPIPREAETLMKLALRARPLYLWQP